MSDAEPTRTPRPARSAWHLLWTVPLALVLTWVAAFWTTLTWCGVSGCSGGGFGRISDPSLPSVLGAALAVALVWFTALAAVPWTTTTRRRLVGAGVGVLVACVVAVGATDGFVR